jgi:hypothetical protein
MARLGRDAEPERLADQGRRRVQLALERGFYRRFLPLGLAPLAGGRACAARYQPRAPAFRLQAAAARGGNRRPPGCRIARDKAILGVFDEGCMGMYNAIIPDELLHPTGVFKERLSQSALYAEMLATSGDEAREVRAWLDRKGVQFRTGSDPETELTDAQILEQCKMYIAALRIADDFGCDAIGIQYQQGLKDLAPASDLAEGLLNNVDRPPVRARGNGRVLHENDALPHFNEVDECAGLDALVTNRIWKALGYPPETTLHDVRYGESYPVNGAEEFVWVFEISGAAPAAHFIGGYAGAVSERQPPMYFRLGGGSLKGISKPGEIVWSRVFVDSGALKADIGRAKVVELPREETERRWRITTPQWPIMHAVTYGITRDQMMARHKSNHVQVAYAPDADAANLALATKAAMFREMGLDVSVCGTGTGCSSTVRRLTGERRIRERCSLWSRPHLQPASGPRPSFTALPATPAGAPAPQVW